MKKIALNLILMICVVSMVGCSNKATAIVTAESIKVGGKTLEGITQYSGTYAEYKDDLVEIQYNICTDIDLCERNTNQVPQEEMVKMKKAKWNVWQHGTMYLMHMKDGKQYIDAYARLVDMGVMGEPDVLNLMYAGVSTLKFTDIKEVKFNNTIKLKVEGVPINLRVGQAAIKDVLLCSIGDPGDKQWSESEIDGKPVQMYESPKYRYYKIGEDTIIQTALTTNIMDYITIL